MGFAAAAVGAVLQRERAAMSFGDLPAEDQADAGAPGLGGEKRNKQVCGIGNAGTFIEHGQIEIGIAAGPFHAHATVQFLSGVDGVAEQIDEQLFELVAIRLQADIGAGRKLYGDTAFEGDDTLH